MRETVCGTPLGRYRQDTIEAAGVWVSTIVRESSAMEHVTPYFETMAFSTGNGPHTLWQSSAGNRREADRQHDLAVRWFSRQAPASGEEEA